jgi:hypothetical protein
MPPDWLLLANTPMRRHCQQSTETMRHISGTGNGSTG